MKEIWKFLLPILKPYKHWYALTLLETIGRSLNGVATIYALKLLVDAFGKGATMYSDLIYPITVYVGSMIVFEAICLLSNFAWMKSQPFVRGDITIKAYDYIQHHSYAYFQNIQSGSIVSKVKSIAEGYNNLWFGVFKNVGVPLLCAIVGITSLSFINIHLFYPILLWAVIFFAIMFRYGLKLSRHATETNDAKHKSIGLIADNITNIFTLFSFTSRKRELNDIGNFIKNDVVSKDYAWCKCGFASLLTGTSMFILMLFSVFFYTIHLHKIGEVTTGDFIFIMTMVYTITGHIWTFTDEFGDLLGKLGDFKSSFSILQTPQKVIDKKDAKELII